MNRSGLAGLVAELWRTNVTATRAIVLIVAVAVLAVLAGVTTILKRLAPYLVPVGCIAIWFIASVFAFSRLQQLFEYFSPALLATYSGVIATVPAGIAILFGLRIGFKLWPLALVAGLFESAIAVLASFAPRDQFTFLVASMVYPLVFCVALTYLVITRKEDNYGSDITDSAPFGDAFGESTEPF